MSPDPTLDEALPRLLPDWLPTQRWFAAKGRAITSVSVVAAVPLRTGDAPLLDHVLVAVTFDDGGTVQHYQLYVARDEAPSGELEHVAIGPVGGCIAYDGLWDPRVTEWLIGALRDGLVVGDLRFVAEPGADIAEPGPGRVLGVEQSNTSVSWGDRSILKTFRLVQPGVNPDLEMHRALRSVGSIDVAALQGAVEGVLHGEPVTLGMLQDFAANSADGWSMALASVRDLLAEADLRADEVGGDFAGESARLGETIAVVHAELRAALGESSREAAELVAGWNRRLDDAVAEVPALAPHADAIRAVYAEVTGTVATQRMHGDLHLGQTLRTPKGWLVLDFEGEPASPLVERTRPDSALRDVAGMLRSFDYAAFHSFATDAEPDQQLVWHAGEWAARNRAAFCDGYALRAGTDPRADGALLNAFELDKAVYETVYETRNRPSWVPIPLGSIARLVGAR
ncbi:maltokinase N-terminal cap-like domain-containing protein [Pseudonocardia sp. CA-107938]|uniref:maltokinase N-terminal cap-like domain-containing protein n=1 Tax=Pseudonocardia sp. CA-107938 TaxID=3240021 RepID=UPI003D8FBD0D